MSKQEAMQAKRSEDFNAWYAEVVQKADLLEHSPISGCPIIKPYGFAIWESIQQFMDAEFKKLGVKNAYFPLLISEELLKKEEKHIEGFAPEVAWVTHGGNSELSERVAIRPTSETIIHHTISKWIRSHRDLPLLLNQWCNVLRWEFKHPVPFLRGREFLWQEGHTAHATKEGADAEVTTILDIYKQTYEELLAVPVLGGRKSQQEKFAGADYTLSLETLFPNGKAIQGCTSHMLGQNFSKAFDISFLNEKKEKKHVWQNSWGFSTRAIGVMIGVHGDDKGLVLPPRIAPIKAVVVPITFSKKPEESEKILALAKQLAQEHSFHLDARDHSPGYRFSEWELKGVPLRIEIGPRDLANSCVTVVERDTGEKHQIAVSEVYEKTAELLEAMQKRIFTAKQTWLTEQIVPVTSMDELRSAVDSGKIGCAAWCGTEESEEAIRKETGAKSLVLQEETKELCFATGKPAEGMYLFGKSY